MKIALLYIFFSFGRFSGWYVTEVVLFDTVEACQEAATGLQKSDKYKDGKLYCQEKKNASS